MYAILSSDCNPPPSAFPDSSPLYCRFLSSIFLCLTQCNWFGSNRFATPNHTIEQTIQPPQFCFHRRTGVSHAQAHFVWCDSFGDPDFRRRFCLLFNSLCLVRFVSLYCVPVLLACMQALTTIADYSANSSIFSSFVTTSFTFTCLITMPSAQASHTVPPHLANCIFFLHIRWPAPPSVLPLIRFLGFNDFLSYKSINPHNYAKYVYIYIYFYTCIQ